MKNIPFLFILMLALQGFAQEKLQTRKIDEFSRVTCEDLLARVDASYSQLKNDSNADAIIFVLSPYQERYKKLIERTYRRNEYEFAKLRVLFSPSSKDGAIWLFRKGSQLPYADLENWPGLPLDLSKPFIWDSYDEDGVCPTFAPSEYAELLRQNDVRGHVVVYVTTRNDAASIGNGWIKQLTEKWNVPRNKLRLFIRKDPKTWTANSQFWIVPRRK